MHVHHVGRKPWFWRAAGELPAVPGIKISVVEIDGYLPQDWGAPVRCVAVRRQQRAAPRVFASVLPGNRRRITIDINPASITWDTFRGGRQIVTGREQVRTANLRLTRRPASSSRSRLSASGS
jgi:hypothetical protein